MSTRAARKLRSLPSAAALLSVVAALLILAPACDKATPVAPADGAISVSVNPTRIDIDGVATVTALATKMDGTPVNEGTEIFFATTLGTIDEMVPTDDRGRAVATLRADGRVGTATITATSGGVASEPLEIQIGSTANSLTLQANPTRVPRTGGTVSLVATVRDELNNPLPGLAVTFRTEAGALDSGGGTVDTNARGEARDRVTVQEFDLAGLSEFLVFAETTGGTGGEDGGAVGDLLEAEEIIDVAGFAATIILTPTPRALPETGGEVTLQAVVLDDTGEPSFEATVIFGSDVGSLESRGAPVLTEADGVARDTLTVTQVDLAAISTRSSFQVTAETPAAAETLQDEATVTILREEGSIVLSASPLSIAQPVGGAGAQITLTAEVLDGAGQPIEGLAVTFFTRSPSIGTLQSNQVLTGATGRATDILTVTQAQIDATCATPPCPSFSFQAVAKAIIEGTEIESSEIITVQDPP